MGVDVAREAAAGAVTPRSGGDTTVRRGHHGSAGGRRLRGPETEMAGTANCMARWGAGPCETPETEVPGGREVWRQGRPERRTAQKRQKSSKPTETIEAQLRI